jgi:Phage tail tube protein
MAGFRGNQAYWLAAKQAGKEETPEAWQDKYLFTEGNLMPGRETDQLSETDANRNAGDFFVTQTGTEGQPGTYIRAASIHHLLEYGLGAAETSGEAETGFTHTITPAATLPYLTLGKGLSATLFEQYSDCKVDELSLKWSTGQPGTISTSVKGRSAVRQAEEWDAEDEPGVPPASNTAAPLSFNGATVKINGEETRLASSFELTISNNLTVQQTDDSIPFDITEGLLAVTFGFDFIIEDLTQYNEFHYGGEAGTAQSPEIFTAEDLTFEFAGVNAKNSLKLVIPKYAYQEFPLEPDAGGAPVVAAVRGAAQRDAEGFVKATVKNEVAS